MKRREGLRPDLLVDGFDIGREASAGFRPVTLLPPSCSERVYALAGGTKRPQFMDGAGHELDETAEAVRGLVGDRLRANLGGRAVHS